MSANAPLTRITFLDSHTGGEPTRLLTSGPDLGGGSVAAQREVLRSRYDAFRRQTLTEPRGSDVLVGALLVPPADPTCQFGVIFFNNVGYLGMCGHGAIGLVASLAYLGRITPGEWRIETPVGVVQATLHGAGYGAAYPNRVSVRNVPAYRLYHHVAVQAGGRTLYGDVAWGGNWFFLVHEHGLEVGPGNLEALTELAWQIRSSLAAQGICGTDGAEIDHVELFAAAGTSAPGAAADNGLQADSRSFVLCPGKAYDRSPCGTGTSAHLACLAADGLLSPGQVWRQQSVVGSVFEGQIATSDDLPAGHIIPTITGEAWVMAEGALLVDRRDPFADGIPGL